VNRATVPNADVIFPCQRIYLPARRPR
jgi:hypothetical protein